MLQRKIYSILYYVPKNCITSTYASFGTSLGRNGAYGRSRKHKCVSMSIYVHRWQNFQALILDQR